jgi:hypothetical protein
MTNQKTYVNSFMMMAASDDPLTLVELIFRAKLSDTSQRLLREVTANGDVIQPD